MLSPYMPQAAFPSFWPGPVLTEKLPDMETLLHWLGSIQCQSSAEA